MRKKTYGVACQVPINQLACRLDSNNHVMSLYYGGWGPNAAFQAAAGAGHIDYLQGGDFWYTQNWCSAWGFLSRCYREAGGVGPSVGEVANVKPVGGGVAFPDNGFAAGVFTIEYVTGMRVCYTAGKKSSAIARIEWDTQKYNAQWIEDPAKKQPPMSQVTVAGGGRTVGCGRPNPVCAFQAEWKAPAGKVIGGIYTKCKYTQGFDKFWSTGLYKPRYYLKSIDKLCAVAREHRARHADAWLGPSQRGAPAVQRCCGLAGVQCASARRTQARRAPCDASRHEARALLPTPHSSAA